MTNNVMLSGKIYRLERKKGLGEKKSTLYNFGLGVPTGRGQQLMFIDVEFWNPDRDVAEALIAHSKSGEPIKLTGKLDFDEWGEGKAKRRKHKLVGFQAAPMEEAAATEELDEDPEF